MIRLPVPFALCTAPDGHRAIEPMHASCCDKASEGDVQHAGPRCTEGACSDTPLGTDPILRSADGDHAQVGSTAALPAVLGLYRVITVAYRAVYDHAVPLPLPRRQHTTIFIC